MPSQKVTAVAPAPRSSLVADVPKVVRSRAPLRLGLAGGGTDVSPFCDQFGGIVLNATIDKYCYTTISGRHDREVHLVSSELDLTDTARDGSSLPLHVAAYRRMCSQFDLGDPGLEITTAAEAPPGSGLGSSSTLVVSIVEAFREFFSLPLGEYEVARLAYEIERVDCSLAGGRQDQYAATFGGFNSMEFSRGERVVVNPLRLKAAVIQEFEASLVLFYSGASRSSGAIIEDQQAHIIGGETDRIEATKRLKEEAVAMKEALLVGNFALVADVLSRGWDAKQLLADGISNSEIESTFETAMRAGAVAGKVSGAGGGGYMMFLVDPTRRPRVVDALSELGSGRVESAHFISEGAVAWTVQ